MLKLYIYGYLNRIQSSRRLEKETRRNVELMWLLERLTPDFRKDNSTGIKNTCRQFIQLYSEMNMLTSVIVAIDGSKFKVVNNKKRPTLPKKANDLIARFDASITHYLAILADKDKQEYSDEDVTVCARKWHG